MPANTPRQAIQNAYTALQRGDKRTAHHWAAYAVKIDPNLEDAWLMLAACSGPRASLAYLERALQINPASQRALQGIQWAKKRLSQPAAPSAASISSGSSAAPAPSFWKIGIFLLFLAFTVPLALIAFQHFPARADSPAPVAGELWADATLKPPEASQTAAPDSFTLADLPDLSAIAASPTPNLVTPTPADAAFEAVQAAETDPAPAVDPVAAADQPLETVTQAVMPEETAALDPDPALVTETAPESESAPLVHTVHPEESLEQIAAWYGVDAAAILALNGLASPDDVQPGLNLLIPQPEPAPVPSKSILVSISQQHLWAYEGDQLVYSFVASTGMGNSTRIGTFEVLDKIPNAYGSTWDIWMPNWMGIYWSGHLENGIHALPILSNGAILWEGYLGTPISYGCVVLGTYEAQLLYDWAEVGTPVHIQW